VAGDAAGSVERGPRPSPIDQSRVNSSQPSAAVITRTDPLTHAESYTYDANGNLAQVTDRKNQVTGYAYDALDRLSTITYQGGATTTFSYDAGNRITQVVDSASGATTRTYDELDRLASETTPQGTVSYTYDAAGRRTTMTASGQATVTYGYDAADRLTSVTQGSATVGLTYDVAGRRSTLTLPNGLTTSYTYDADHRVTRLAWAAAGTAVGDLTYTYDAAGRRTALDGSFARTGIPPAQPPATYDLANRILTWNGTPFTYDLNGNLTSDGSTTYSWNARNQLAPGRIAVILAKVALDEAFMPEYVANWTRFACDGSGNRGGVSASVNPSLKGSRTIAHAPLERDSSGGPCSRGVTCVGSLNVGSNPPRVCRNRGHRCCPGRMPRP